MDGEAFHVRICLKISRVETTCRNSAQMTKVLAQLLLPQSGAALYLLELASRIIAFGLSFATFPVTQAKAAGRGG